MLLISFIISRLLCLTFLLSNVGFAAEVNDQILEKPIPKIGDNPHPPQIVHDVISSIDGPRPFYMIGHRVLVRQGVKDAVSHGANAIEIDMRADASGKAGWWAQHDAVPSGRGDAAQAMFEVVADLRQQGKQITFVWLDLKNPDECDPNDSNRYHCSILGLRDMAREILEPLGVRVLYGFYKDTMGGRAFQLISSNLVANEALNIDGNYEDVAKAFESLSVPQSNRVFSNGLFTLGVCFGDCRTTGPCLGKRYTCAECARAVRAKDFGKVFSWTVTSGQAGLVDQLLSIAKVDGLIYGRGANMYDDGEDCRAVSRDILGWIRAHPEAVTLATNDQPPW